MNDFEKFYNLVSETLKAECDECEFGKKIYEIINKNIVLRNLFVYSSFTDFYGIDVDDSKNNHYFLKVYGDGLVVYPRIDLDLFFKLIIENRSRTFEDRKNGSVEYIPKLKKLITYLSKFK